MPFPAQTASEWKTGLHHVVKPHKTHIDMTHTKWTKSARHPHLDDGGIVDDGMRPETQPGVRAKHGLRRKWVSLGHAPTSAMVHESDHQRSA